VLNLQRWTNSRRLKLSVSKSEVIWFGTRQQLAISTFSSGVTRIWCDGGGAQNSPLSSCKGRPISFHDDDDDDDDDDDFIIVILPRRLW